MSTCPQLTLTLPEGRRRGSHPWQPNAASSCALATMGIRGLEASWESTSSHVSRALWLLSETALS